MCTLRRCSAFIFAITIFAAMISGCAAKKEEASYEERRHMPLPGELSMEAMEYTENIDGTAKVEEAYRTEIRQDVYLSDGKGGYRELGDVTWRGWESLQEFPFSVTYEDDYRIHIEMPQYGIDRTEKMHTSFQELVGELGIYDEAGKVTEYGRTAWAADTLQSQALRYIEEDGAVTLRYEAQIASGYSEYGLGWCFVFLYDITDSGYVLISVTLERFDY